MDIIDKKQQIPIFVHHEGNASYLKDCIKQAKKYNDRVILFGDRSNINMCQEWYDVSEFSSVLWQEFMIYYSNMSHYNDSYATQIIKRFFVFDDFMIKNNIKKCICLDSDVLVYINFSEISELDKYKAAFAIPKNQENMRIAASAGCSYWTQEALHEFLLYCIDIYKNQYGRLKEKWEYHQKNNMAGGVCEMNLLYWWWQQNQTYVLNWIKYSSEGVIDGHFGMSENYLENEYQMDKHEIGKRILVKDGLPYFFSVQHGPVKAWAIHFVGNKKMYMQYFRKHLRIAFWIPYLNKFKTILKHFLIQ